MNSDGILGIIIFAIGLLVITCSLYPRVRRAIQHWRLTRALTAAEKRLFEKPETPDRMDPRHTGRVFDQMRYNKILSDKVELSRRSQREIEEMLQEVERLMERNQ